MGLNLTTSRIQSAQKLARLVKLDQLAVFRQGNALDMPFTDNMFDVVSGQEAPRPIAPHSGMASNVSIFSLSRTTIRSLNR